MPALFPISNFGKNHFVTTDAKGNLVGRDMVADDLPYGQYDSTVTYTEAQLKAVLAKGLVCAKIGTNTVFLFVPEINTTTFTATKVYGGAKGYTVTADGTNYSLTAIS